MEALLVPRAPAVLRTASKRLAAIDAYCKLYQHCKVLALHGPLTHHVSHARARYSCRMAVHTASTLVVQYRPHSELEFGIQSETNITREVPGKLHKMSRQCFASPLMRPHAVVRLRLCIRTVRGVPAGPLVMLWAMEVLLMLLGSLLLLALFLLLVLPL